MKHFTNGNERQRFYELHEQGQTYEEIAETFGISKECVRMWSRRLRAGGTTQDRYTNSRAGVLSQFSPEVKAAIVELREAHSRWGPASIRMHLAKDEQLDGHKLPSRASIGRYLHSFEKYRHTPKKRSLPNGPTQLSRSTNVG